MTKGLSGHLVRTQLGVCESSCRLPAQLRERDAFAGTRERLIEQRFERRRCRAAKHCPHRRFESDFDAWKLSVRDMLAEQGLDGFSERGGHGERLSILTHSRKQTSWHSEAGIRGCLS